MPQLDHVTYFSQSFWLTVFFLSFYVILVKTLLPRISTILKLRKKLIDSKTDSQDSSQVENLNEISPYDQVLMNALNESRNLITETSQTSQIWQENTAKSINKENLAPVQEEYINAMGQIVAKKYILKSLLEESK